MPYAAILTHVGPSSTADRRLKLAADLARQFDSTLIGIGAEQFEPPVAAAAMGYVDGQTLVAEAKVVQDDLRLAEARFGVAAAKVRAGFEWRCGVGIPADLVVENAHTADLIVAGPCHAQPWGFDVYADPGEILMRSGRPLLVTPPDLEALDASSIVIGWKDTRESRGALSDALPFLQRARQVAIAEVCEGRNEAVSRKRLADVAQYLARHGVLSSTIVRDPGGATVAEALLEVADMQDAGLIVVGGYGHARLREWAFGGVTRELLAGAHRSVLLSH